MPNYITDPATAASILHSAQRILVVGCSGSGKTTFSNRVSRHFNLPHISMDKAFFWLPGWVSRPREEQRRMIAEAIKEERWIMDGTNPSSFDMRVPRSDIVIWVRMPRLLCLWGVAKRGFKYRGRTRYDMADGCVEQIPDREFISYIWNFEKAHAPLLIRNFDLFGPEKPVVVLKSRRDVRELLDLAGCRD